MHIVLLILKILLIAVLSILGLAIALLLLVLLAPVRYRAYVRKEDAFFAKASATWLGFVICGKAVYDDDGLRYRLRLFGGTIIDSERDDADGEETPDDEEAASQETDSISDDGYEPPDIPTDLDSEAEAFIADDAMPGKSGKGLFSRLGKRLDAIAGSVRLKLKALREKAVSLKNKKDGYTKLMRSAVAKEAIRVVKKQLIVLLKHIKPTKLNGQVVYGAGDPADTGKHLGYMSLLYPLDYDHIDVTPDFEEKRLEGHIYLKGRIRLWVVCWCALRVVLNRSCRAAFERFKKI